MKNFKKILLFFPFFFIPIANANPIPDFNSPSPPSTGMIIAIFITNFSFNFFVGLSGFSLFNKDAKKALLRYSIILFVVTLIGLIVGYFTFLQTYGTSQVVYGIYIPYPSFVTVALVELALFSFLFTFFKIFTPRQSFLVSLLIVSLGLMIGIVTRISSTPITPLTK